MHASGLTELVGREEEIEILLRRWSKIKTGEGQVVLLSGGAGWHRDGSLVHEEDVAYGLENAPKALLRLFAGANFGKQLVKVADAASLGRSRQQ